MESQIGREGAEVGSLEGSSGIGSIGADVGSAVILGILSKTCERNEAQNGSSSIVSPDAARTINAASDALVTESFIVYSDLTFACAYWMKEI
jgi:hypothetical protein